MSERHYIATTDPLLDPARTAMAALRAEGKTWEGIGDHFGCAPRTLQRIVNGEGRIKQATAQKVMDLLTGAISPPGPIDEAKVAADAAGLEGFMRRRAERLARLERMSA